MSGTFPANPLPSACRVRSEQPTLVSVAHSLKRQVRSRNTQRFGFRLEWSAVTRAEMAPILAFALAQRGRYGSFSFVPPIVGSPRGAAGGTPVADGATSTGRSVPTAGWPNAAAVLKAGDFVKFAGHAKVYMLTADATSNGTGQATLAIEPALRAAVANGEALTVTAVPFTMAFDADVTESGVRPGALFDWSCDLVEVL